jgi:hypothetical protein
MKFRNFTILSAIALIALSPLTSNASECSNSTIQGAYAFTIHGQVFLPNGASLLIDGLAKTTFDGKGNVTQLDAVATNGNVPPGWRTSTGTYSVDPDCTGTFTVSNGDQPPIHTQIIVAQSGNTIHAIVIDPGFATTSDAERIRVPKGKD